MSSILFSTSCYIKDNRYNIRICIDQYSSSTFDNILLTNDDFQSKSDTVDNSSSIQIEFELLTDETINSKKNIDDTIPRLIPLNAILNVKQVEKLSNESTEINLNYVEMSESFLWTVKRLELKIDSISNNQLYLILNENLTKLKDRPRNLLVFVNPQCGKGEGNLVYDEKVLPLFKESNINVKTIYTEYCNHARDYLNENCFDNYDGLICVGGDGIFSEICFSLLSKTAQKFNIDLNDKNVKLIRPSIRIGIIPAGSTDAVVFGTTGHNDPVTSALQIITGQSIFIDITTVHNENGFVRFMATTLAYGFFGDIIQQSDNWRFFGPARYNLSGVVQYLRNKSYLTQLTIIQPEQKYSSKTLVQNLSANSQTSFTTDSEIKLEGQYRSISCLNMPCRCEKSKYGISPSVHLGDGSFDIIVVKRSWRMGLFRFLHNVANDGRTIDDLSNVERYRATKIIINPIVNQEEDLGNWSCDGELIKANQITISAHQQILNLFASGINTQQIKLINQIDQTIFN